MEKYIVKIQVQPQYLNVFKAFNNSTDNFINRILQLRNYKKIKDFQCQKVQRFLIKEREVFDIQQSA